MYFGSCTIVHVRREIVDGIEKVEPRSCDRGSVFLLKVVLCAERECHNFDNATCRLLPLKFAIVVLPFLFWWNLLNGVPVFHNQPIFDSKQIVKCHVVTEKVTLRNSKHKIALAQEHVIFCVSHRRTGLCHLLLERYQVPLTHQRQLDCAGSISR